MGEIPKGLCGCGCGEHTNLAKQNKPEHGHIAGEPLRFLLNHDKRIAAVEYVEEDRGHDTPCWIWQRSFFQNGYGQASAGGGRSGLAHRIFYERRNGPIPAGRQLDHLCEVPACVNPAHLQLATAAANTRRRSATKLTAESVRSIRALLGTVPRRELAERFGVSRATINHIATGRIWAGV